MSYTPSYRHKSRPISEAAVLEHALDLHHMDQMIQVREAHRDQVPPEMLEEFDRVTEALVMAHAALEREQVAPCYN